MNFDWDSEDDNIENEDYEGYPDYIHAFRYLALSRMLAENEPSPWSFKRSR